MSDDIYIAGPAPADDRHFDPAGELVRFAEKLLEQGDIAQALECLHEALKRQPDNLYILAIIRRAETIQRDIAQPPQGPKPKTLSLTLDSRHPTGIRHEAAESPKDVEPQLIWRDSMALLERSPEGVRRVAMATTNFVIEAVGAGEAKPELPQESEEKEASEPPPAASEEKAAVTPEADSAPPSPPEKSGAAEPTAAGPEPTKPSP